MTCESADEHRFSFLWPRHGDLPLLICALKSSFQTSLHFSFHQSRYGETCVAVLICELNVYKISIYLWHRIIAGCCDPGMFLMFSLYTLSQNRTKCFDNPPCMTLDTWTKHVMRVFAKCWQSAVFIRQMRRVWSWTPHLRHGHCILCQSSKNHKSSKRNEMFEHAPVVSDNMNTPCIL